MCRAGCRVARRNGENKNERTKIAESRRKGIFLHFLLENCLTTEISTRKIMSQRQIGGSDLPPHPHERWHGNMSTGLISENSLAFCCPAPTQERKI